MATLASQVFRLPDLGEGLTEAELVRWLVAVGDEIAVDQAVAEVETAKSIVELPSPYAGTVRALHGRPGEALKVGAPVLEVGTPGEPEGAVRDAAAAGSGSGSGSGGLSVELQAHRAEEQAGSGNVLIGYGTSEHPGAVRRRPRRQSPTADPGRGAAQTPARDAAQLPARDAAQLPARDPGGVAPEATASVSPPPSRTAVRSPLVRRLARDLGIDVTTIAATGKDGAVTRADVLRAAGTAPPAPTGDPVEVDGLTVVSRERMSMLRRAVSAKLRRSRAEIPEATVWVDVDVTDLWRMRSGMAGAGQHPPSFTAILARYVLLALEDYPLLAGRVDGEVIVQFDGVNLGVATDTDRGLVVPVIPRADRLAIADLDASLRSLAADARGGVLPPERLTGSTFTLNNYGSFGVDGSAAIINHPEVAILGIGRVRERAWAVDGELAVRRIAQLSLVFDHRICDGGYAAGFLRRVVDALESPLSLYGRL